MKMDHEESLLRRAGLAVQAPDAGCCGMAGAFGFAADTYAVAQAIGERRLLPAVRAASADAVIVADGFSCREQIRQSTGRQAVHLAQVLHDARHDGD
jgi:Fe-S oxidoreductase